MANWLILTDGARRLMWSHEKSGDGHSPAARINGRKKRKNIGKQRMKINWMRPSSAEKAHRAGQVIECLRKECVQTCFSNPSHRWRVARPAGWVLLLPAYSLNMRLASYLFFSTKFTFFGSHLISCSRSNACITTSLASWMCYATRQPTKCSNLDLHSRISPVLRRHEKQYTSCCDYLNINGDILQQNDHSSIQTKWNIKTRLFTLSHRNRHVEVYLERKLCFIEAHGAPNQVSNIVTQNNSNYNRHRTDSKETYERDEERQWNFDHQIITRFIWGIFRKQIIRLMSFSWRFCLSLFFRYYSALAMVVHQFVYHRKSILLNASISLFLFLSLLAFFRILAVSGESYLPVDDAIITIAVTTLTNLIDTNAVVKWQSSYFFFQLTDLHACNASFALIQSNMSFWFILAHFIGQFEILFAWNTTFFFLLLLLLIASTVSVSSSFRCHLKNIWGHFITFSFGLKSGELFILLLVNCMLHTITHVSALSLTASLNGSVFNYFNNKLHHVRWRSIVYISATMECVNVNVCCRRAYTTQHWRSSLHSSSFDDCRRPRDDDRWRPFMRHTQEIILLIHFYCGWPSFKAWNRLFFSHTRSKSNCGVSLWFCWAKRTLNLFECKQVSHGFLFSSHKHSSVMWWVTSRIIMCDCVCTSAYCICHHCYFSYYY